MPTFSSSTGPITYDVRGDGQPIILLPSGGHDRHDYDELRDRLPSDLSSIALDWPAHGDSPPGDGRATESRLADIAEEITAALAPNGAVIVGNSVGGYAAARMALRRPELVRGLVLIDAGGFEGRSLQGQLFSRLMGRPWFLRAIYPAFSRHYMRARTPADRAARESAIALTRSDTGARALSELWASFAQPSHHLGDQVPNLRGPTLLVWGRRDPVLPVRVARALARALPDASLVELDTGHVPHTSDPDAVAAALVPFALAAFSRTAAGQPA